MAQIAFIDKLNIDSDITKSYKLVKDESGNRVVNTLYVTTDGATSLTVNGYANGTAQGLTGINIVSLAKNDYQDKQTQLYIVEPFTKVEIEVGASDDAEVIVKGVY